MITGIDLKQTIDYVAKNDDVENPTIWKLGMLSGYLFARVCEGSENNKIETIYKVLQLALKGWENFNIPFTTVKEKFFGHEVDVVPMSILERIPLNIVTDISVKIMEINQLTEVESKN